MCSINKRTQLSQLVRGFHACKIFLKHSFGRGVDFLYHIAARYSNHTTGIRCILYLHILQIKNASDTGSLVAVSCSFPETVIAQVRREVKNVNNVPDSILHEATA